MPGLSDTIRVRSIVGRYLEHSRIFRFGGIGGRPLRVAIGSPDLMERNLDRRVEVVVPVADPDLQRRLVGILDWALLDEANSWVLRPDGGVGPGRPDLPPDGLGLSLQDQFQTQALASRRSRRDASRCTADAAAGGCRHGFPRCPEAGGTGRAAAGTGPDGPGRPGRRRGPRAAGGSAGPRVGGQRERRLPAPPPTVPRCRPRPGGGIDPAVEEVLELPVARSPLELE